LEPAFAFGDGFRETSTFDQQLDKSLAHGYRVGLTLKRGADGVDGAAPVLLQATHLRKAQIALQRRIARLHSASQHPRCLLQPTTL
jgi:hypothetical protein